MAFEVSFNSANKLYLVSNSDANKEAINTQPNLTWKSITENDFIKIVDGVATVTGFTEDTVNYSEEPTDETSDISYTYKTTLEDYVEHLKKTHNAFLSGHSNAFNSVVTASLTALNSLNLDTIVTWVADEEGNQRVEKTSPVQIIREANSSIIHDIQIP
tara:strand:- start:2201 stop:2677 length:477 start_codon:yes stop_codon:yes gene_type:complete